MAKRILTLCLALVIGIAFAMPATAAVKSIKVGGDLTIRGIYRENLDFVKIYPNTANSWLMSTTRIWIAPELTDNISAVVRLLNERDWNQENVNSSTLVQNTTVDLDLANIKLKDLFFPGFTATLGRQEILLGKGFVVGNLNGKGGFGIGTIGATDLTARKSFDAWRLDYEVGAAPVAITFFDAKIYETANGFIYGDRDNDSDLLGLNVGYETDNFKVSGYALMLSDQTPANAENTNTDLYTFGARIDHNVIPGLNYNIEAAIQNGEYVGTHDMGGWSGNADVSYAFQTPMEFKIGASWFYAVGDAKRAKGNWVPLYPDNMSDRIGRIPYACFGAAMETNVSAPKVYGSFKPFEKNALSLAVFPATTRVATPAGRNDAFISNVDFGYTYQYTEDVSFGLNVDFARAGKHIKEITPNFSGDAWEVIGTVAVAF